MIQLSTYFSEEEKEVLSKCAGSKFEVLSHIEGDSYVLCEGGEYSYNECFDMTDIDFFVQQKYEKVKTSHGKSRKSSNGTERRRKS